MTPVRSIIAGLAVFFAATAAEAATLDDLKAEGALDIGVREDARPFSFIDSEGQAAGYSVDLCARIAEDIGAQLGTGELELRYHLVSAEDRLEKLRNGDVDIVCGATTNTLLRQEEVGFSLLTFITGADMLMRREASYQSLADLAGKPIGARDGTTTERGLKTAMEGAENPPALTTFDSHQEGLGALITGEIEAYFADRVLLNGIRENSPSASDLKLAGRFFSYEPYALAVRRDDPDFRLAVDRSIAKLYRTGEIGEIYGTWFPGSSPSDLLKALYILQGLPEE